MDTTEDALSTGPAVPQCGNGMIDKGEQCDDESGACVDCRFVCGFSDPIALGLTSDSVVTDDAAPRGGHAK